MYNFNSSIFRMKNLFKHMFLCVVVTFFLPIYAEDDKLHTDPRVQISLPSTEAQSLGKFSEVPVDLYTGRVNINIPLFTISHNDIEVPISLSYHGGGIKVDDECGLVGLGWTLNAGGVVSRIVRGMPDDLYGPINGLARGYDKLDADSKIFIDSLMHRQRPRNPMAVLDSANQRHMLKPMEHYGQLYDENKMDVAPDNYVFYAQGMSGAFVGTNAEYVQSSGGCKIQSPSNGNYYILNDVKGHRYTFSHQEKRRFAYRLENVFNKIPSDINPEYSHLYTSAWWLSSIISSANDTVKFDYITEKQLPTRHSFYGYTQYDTIIEMAYGNIIPGYVDQVYNDHQYPYRRVGADTIYHKLLSKIKTPHCLLQFHYSYNQYSYSRLDSISLYAMQGPEARTLIESFKFVYSDHTNTARLSSLKHWGRNDKYQSYKFTYHTTTTTGFSNDNRDHWGCYSSLSEGRFANKSYLGVIPQGLTGSVYTERYADNWNASHNMLKSITYPSGLEVNLTWEPHQFSELSAVGKEAHAILGEYDYSHPFLLDCNVGGVRIKRIEYMDKGQQLLAKEYTYVDSNGASTGILAYPPRYAAKYPILTYCEPYGDYTSVEYESRLLVLRSNGLPYVLNGGGHIEYKQVTEHTIPNISMLDSSKINRIDYYFSTSDSVTKSDVDETLHDTLISADMLQLTSMRHRRGDLIKKVEHTDDYKVTDYTYLISEQPNVKQIPGCLFPIADYQQSHMHYTWNGHSVNPYKNFGIVKYRVIPYNKRLTQEITTSDKVITCDTYSYTSLIYQNSASANLPQTHSYLDSDGDMCVEHYEYWGSTNKIKKYIATKNGYVTDAYTLEYDNWGRVLEKKVALLSSTSPQTTSNLNDWYLVETYEYYPKINKLKEVHNHQKNITTTYLWSYGGQYPIAEIQNDSLETIENKVGHDALLALQYSYEPNMSMIDALRSQLPHAQITTMTYTPLIGMTSHTDAKGYAQYYEYDDFGRISEIYENVNGTKNILKSFDYQLQNQQ